MPSPWVALLKNVPWIDVIRNAAAVADGARKLWSSVRGQQPGAKAGGVLAELPGGADSSPGALHARLAAAERAMASLQEEMLASSELIRNLAEQNGQLVARVDELRRRTVWLAAAAGAAALLALAALLVVLLR